MRKRKGGYFKHYNTSTIGDSIQSSFKAGNFFAPNLWWFLLEKCNQLDTDFLEFKTCDLARIFHVREDKMRREVIAFARYFGSNIVEVSDKTCSFLIGNYLKSQETRFPIKDVRLKIKNKKNPGPPPKRQVAVGVLEPTSVVIPDFLKRLQERIEKRNGHT